MRKIIPLILSLALVLALAACGSNDTTSEATTGTTAAEDTSTPHRGHHHQPERQRGPHGPHRPL